MHNSVTTNSKHDTAYRDKHFDCSVLILYMISWCHDSRKRRRIEKYMKPEMAIWQFAQHSQNAYRFHLHQAKLQDLSINCHNNGNVFKL